MSILYDSDEPHRSRIQLGDHQRLRCQTCCRSFQLEYEYRACQQSMKEQIVDLAMNNAGICDTARALHISINAVVRTLKNSRRDV